jgi:ABC-2 type transport system permease protein
MIKYLKLYWHFLRFSISKSLLFRFDFTFRIVMDCIFYFVHIAFFKVIFGHAGFVGDWSQEQVMIFVSAYLIADAIQMTLFSNNTWMIPIYINKGDLDYYLLRPVSDLFFLSLREFAFNSFINLILAIGINIYFIQTSSLSFEWWQIVLFYVLIFNGAYIHLLIRLMAATPVFWTHSGRGLEATFWTLERFAEKPDSIYKGWLRYGLMFVIPFVAVSSFPSRVLFGESVLEVTAYCLGISVIFTYFTIKLWELGLKNYSSASS